MNPILNCVAVCLSLALPVLAAPPAGDPAGNEVRPPASREGWLVPEDALPEGVTLSDELATQSVQARTFFDNPSTSGILPEPVGKLSQTLVTLKDDWEHQGSLLVFEYAGDVPQDVRDFVPGLLWGELGGPSPEHPENVLFAGPYLVILSFDNGDVSGDWLRTRMFAEFGLRIPRTWVAVAPLMNEYFEFLKVGDVASARALFEQNAELLSEYALSHFLTGDLAASTQDWALCETAYARALQLQDEQIDPLPGGEKTVWTALDGLGLALIAQGKDKPAIPVLERAVELAGAMGQAGPAAQSSYNLACAFAKTRKYKEALEALTLCLDTDRSRYLELAREDPDFEAARKRSEFRKLLEPAAKR